ncbi:hypothetical protein LCGC14_1606570 [marine sediment metagenome]|uniref:Uncharacterized protein n=1 Tax=marine sediment metagenome TaxID=412755 RepID=A0A0F9L9K1_9ZZZZ
MSGTSKISTRISIRLPNDVVRTLTNRINGKRGRWDSVGDYLRELIITEIKRNHNKKKRA